MQKTCVALTGLGFIRLLARVTDASRPPPWALLPRAFSAGTANPSHYQFLCYRPLVDINRATKAELEKLPDIGEA
jgi:DNA uptake protein ComE-like DNA-binding protein